ncbi:MAG TPA: cyclic nucleotide-binding domain-containing protein [Paludibaculum sp.]|jgi:CRP-like cAMP-binding protein
MKTETLEAVLKTHPFLGGLAEHHLHSLVSCAKNVRFEDGDYLSREGEQADVFYLIREGEVAVEIRLPEKGGIRVDTLGADDILGWSWIIAPYVWHYDTRAVGVVRALVLDAKCLRNKSEADHDLGYELLKRFAPLIEQRLSSTRMQLLDVYGRGAS